MDIEQALCAAVERAIEDARNNRHEDLPEWSENRLAFLLCQHLLSVRGVRDTPASELEPYAVAFWSATHDLDVWEYDQEEFYNQFSLLWDEDKVRHPCGNLLEIAKQNAKRAKLHPVLLRYNNNRIRYLGQVCYELATLYGDGGKFFLSQADAGQIIGRTQHAARDAIYRLCADGVLSLTGKGSNLTKKASTYIWLPSV